MPAPITPFCPPQITPRAGCLSAPAAGPEGGILAGFLAHPCGVWVGFRRYRSGLVYTRHFFAVTRMGVRNRGYSEGVRS